MPRDQSVRKAIHTMAVMAVALVAMLLSARSTTGGPDNAIPKCSGQVYANQGTEPCGPDSPRNKACTGGWFEGQKDGEGNPVKFDYCTGTGAVPQNNCTTLSGDQNTIRCGVHGFCTLVEGECETGTEFVNGFHKVDSQDSPCTIN